MVNSQNLSTVLIVALIALQYVSQFLGLGFEPYKD